MNCLIKILNGAAIIFFGLPAEGATYRVPSIPEHLPVEKRVVIKNDLKEDTTVEHSCFSVVVPKAWTIQPMGPDGKIICSLLAVASKSLCEQDNRFDIFLSAGRQYNSIEEVATKMRQQKRSSEVSFVIWQGRKWVLQRTRTKEAKTGRQIITLKAMHYLGSNTLVAYAVMDARDAKKLESMITNSFATIMLQP